MPLVRIDIMEGRPPEKIRELHSRVAELVAEILDTPIERVRTYITQFPPEGWGIGGVPADVARADEVNARRAATAHAQQDVEAEDEARDAMAEQADAQLDAEATGS